MGDEKLAVLLLSGGMDSSTLLAKLLNEGWIVNPVIFDYGQRHQKLENEAAQKLISFYKVGKFAHLMKDAKVIKLDLTQIGNSALTDNIDVPDNMEEQAKTVVPYRNTLMTTLATAYAETINVTDIFITPVKEDFEAYPDCRATYFNSLSTTLSLGATKQPTEIQVHVPFVNTWKADVISLGFRLGVPYDLTHTCYNGISPACGECPACRERLNAFKLNGVEDPIPYVKIPEVLV